MQCQGFHLVGALGPCTDQGCALMRGAATVASPVRGRHFVLRSSAVGLLRAETWGAFGPQKMCTPKIAQEEEERREDVLDILSFLMLAGDTICAPANMRGNGAVLAVLPETGAQGDNMQAGAAKQDTVSGVLVDIACDKQLIPPSNTLTLDLVSIRPLQGT
ncbi:hypothetical protein NDU88_006062 [Pleurodeles waltl]|uniref:Uncharacterized protein n=1 Tax=Pleurodeles waltl TaxID=8319 RepID=A0AAV7MY49_PLEWA|nr:hypothetical protein NDU88_006062 [Pleurodeles waltl]